LSGDRELCLFCAGPAARYLRVHGYDIRGERAAPLSETSIENETLVFLLHFNIEFIPKSSQVL
jgi:hypothetical protein